jgi:hypothetical protein
LFFVGPLLVISELVIHPGESFFPKADLLTRPLINLDIVAQRIGGLKVGGATVSVPASGVILARQVI